MDLHVYRHGHEPDWNQRPSGDRWCRTCDRQRKRAARLRYYRYDWLGACERGHRKAWRWSRQHGDWQCWACIISLSAGPPHPLRNADQTASA